MKTAELVENLYNFYTDQIFKVLNRIYIFISKLYAKPAANCNICKILKTCKNDKIQTLGKLVADLG